MGGRSFNAKNINKINSNFTNIILYHIHETIHSWIVLSESSRGKEKSSKDSESSPLGKVSWTQKQSYCINKK